MEKISDSEATINNITLEYLMNPMHYEKYMHDKLGDINAEFSKDRKFYRKRILLLTKEMLHGRYESIYLKPGFNAYIKQLIMYFKEIDKKDIIQEDYNLLDISNEMTNERTNEMTNYMTNETNMNNIIMRDLNVKKITLDSFVITNNNYTSEEKQILPIKKDINLRDPSLREKGVKKNFSEKNNK